MMLAAAQFGERKKGVSPPEALVLALQCRRWGGLPLAGGVLDQPAWLMEQMAACLNIFDACRAYVDKPPKVNDVQFSTNNPSAWRVLMSVEKLRHPELFARPDAAHPAPPLAPPHLPKKQGNGEGEKRKHVH